MKDILKRCENHLKELEKTKKAMNELVEGVKQLKREIEQRPKKPKMVYKSGHEVEITKYTKYSDKFIEFELENCICFRYIEYGKSEACIYPNNKMTVTLEKHIGHAFEQYDFISRKYVENYLINHIELLEGVDEYDNSCCNH